ncbi:response regulator [Oryzifoliimicrobium ureilyticus]|uniref:response regulator n=1 Tax=Oryzifoliimicrobium ureilyticus TaxID=3113724 RepID=UPI003F673316
MTQRLLSFSRRSDQGSKPLDLVRALRDLEPLLRQLANDSVVLEYEIDPRLWPVVADPKALEIAMVNLVTNAREAMPSGGVVTVRASNITNVSREVEGLTGAFVAIAISDTGSGMKPTLTSKAFDPLFSTKGPGAAGLGLTQVLTFAERSGGTAKLVSVEDVGTAVTLYLPRSQKEVEEEPPDTASAALPKRILIVDDTPSSLISARLSLEEEDIEILTAGSGPEALRILAQDRNIDLLLSDIMMPGMSGIELARETARLSEDIIILLMTGFSDQLEQGVKIEFPVLMKPFSQAELRAALKRAVKGKSGQA